MTVPWPRDLTLQSPTPAVATTGDNSVILPRLQLPGIVNAVSYIPTGTQNGAATNNRTLTLFNRGQGAGTGTVQLATLALVSGTNLTDNVPSTLALSTTGLTVAVGDVLEFVSAHVSTGVADPGGLVVVTFAMNS